MACDLNFQLQQITQPCNFQHDEQIFIHCYFLLLLMPETPQYICPRFDTRRISQVIATYFKLNLFKKGCFHWYCTSGIWVECLLTRGRRGGGGTPKNSWWKCAATWFSKSWAYFRPKNIIFHTRFQNWPLRPGPPYLRVWMAIPPSYLKVWICHCAGQVWNQVVVGSNVSPQNSIIFVVFF